METFQDQSHIDQVRDALWAKQGNGASVMVGSGFTKYALKMRPDADDPPILSDLANELHRRLYPRTDEEGRETYDSETVGGDRIPNLAQEYVTAFGRGNLHLVLQQLIRDDEFKPGEAHSRLLRLPWRDVFTTNWDTLLERTRPHVVDRSYSVVRDMDEIPLANKPRIVKLHGSVPAQFPLILTEEDYRTYPTKFAPFVNTVQQAMMETVFCLIGFSGNDPNFLNWSGWVRDNLGTSAPKIYLAGWLDLPRHRRRMLECRGIVPIDLARHLEAHKWPEHQRYLYATEWVLHTLERGRPYDVTYWPSLLSQRLKLIPKDLKPVATVTSREPKEEFTIDRNKPEFDEDQIPEKVKETLAIWGHNRRVYPGWLLLPEGVERVTLRSRTNDWEPLILAALSSLKAVERLNAIYELVWRREILLEPICDELESAAEDTLKSIDCHNRTVNDVAESKTDWIATREEWRSVALALVTAARVRFDEELFDERIALCEPFTNDHPDVYNRLYQERCLRTVSSLDFEALGNILEDWTVEDCDPIWMIRKAALLWESDQNDKAAELVKDALEAIRAIPDAEGSVVGASREGWALWSALTLDNRQEITRRWDKLNAIKCDAELEMDLIARRMKGRDKEQEAPHFDLGVRRGEGFRFTNERPDLDAFRAVRLTEVAGLPPITKYEEPVGLSVASDILRLAAVEMASIQPELAIRLVLRVSNSETDETLERVLPRTRAATLSESSVETLSDICICVINYASPRLITADGRSRSFPWITRMRVATEVLSRLALRTMSEKAEGLFDIGLQCVQSHEVAQEFWLHKSVGNLLRRTWGVLPKNRRTARAVDLLSLPIIGMENFTTNVADFFPDPAEFLQSDDLSSVRTSENDSQWSDTVNFLIRGLEGDVEARKRALGRILMVFEARLLTESEMSAVAQAVWSERHTALDSLPAGTNLPDWVFLWLPEPNSGTAEQLFRLKWLSRDIDNFKAFTQSDSNTFSVSLGKRPENPDIVEDVLWNVGTAISALRNFGSTLQLSEKERKFVEDLVEYWVDADFPSHPIRYVQAAARESTVWALRGLRSILPEVVILQPTGERLFEKLRKLTDSGTPCFELIHSVVRTIPKRIDELVTWLWIGLASDDDALTNSAIVGLHSWLEATMNTEAEIQVPPEHLVREIGLMIATRRNVALPQALPLATWIFSKGTPEHRQLMNDLAAHGLRYLAEELAYDREHDLDGNVDLPLLRWRCVELAQAMAESGMRDEPAVDLWLKLGEEDPLPEARYAVTSLDDTGEAGF